MKDWQNYIWYLYLLWWTCVPKTTKRRRVWRKLICTCITNLDPSKPPCDRGQSIVCWKRGRVADMLSKKRDRFLRVVDKQETMNGDGEDPETWLSRAGSQCLRYWEWWLSPVRRRVAGHVWSVRHHMSIPNCRDPWNRRDSGVNARAFVRRAHRWQEDDDEEEEGVRIERTRRERIIMNYMGLSEGLNQWGVSRPIKILWPTSVFFSFNSLQFLVILQNLPNFVWLIKIWGSPSFSQPKISVSKSTPSWPLALCSPT